MKIEQLAYLAGFFDGEGCVYILCGRQPNGNPKYGLEISFTNSNIAPLEIAQECFGGQISRSTDKRKTSKPTHRLRIRNRQAANALTAMLPFMIVKRSRAEMALAFQAKASARSLTFDEAAEYKQRITALNDKVWNRTVL